MLFNALDMKFRELKLRKDPKCPVCGPNPTVTELIDYEMFCGIQPEPVNPGSNPDEVSLLESSRSPRGHCFELRPDIQEGRPRRHVDMH
jgi:adenylyltransferase/sulfurtransferase